MVLGTVDSAGAVPEACMRTWEPNLGWPDLRCILEGFWSDPSVQAHWAVLPPKRPQGSSNRFMLQPTVQKAALFISQSGRTWQEILVCTSGKQHLTL